MCNNHMPGITYDELKTKLGEKGIALTAEELSAVVEAIADLSREKSDDGLFTLLSFRWKTPKNRYVKISIPW